MPTEILLVGAGGHAKVVYAALKLQVPDSRVRLVDDDPALDQRSFLDIRVEAASVDWKGLPRLAHVSIGGNRARQAVALRLVKEDRQLFTVIHPQAVVSKFATVGDGVFIAALAVVAPAASIGRGAIVNHAAIVDHDCVISPFVHVAPNATLGGGVQVGEGALIGSGAVVLPGLKIGRNAIVAAGAVVTRDVPPDATVLGIPARNENMLTQIDRFITTRTETLRGALEKINDNSHRLLLLVDEQGRLIRTITDGDIRRLLLGGATLDDQLSRLPKRRPTTLPVGTATSEVLKLMIDRTIDHVPVLDGEGRPVGLFERQDLDTDILLSTPHLSKYERDYVEEAFSSNWVAPLGPNVDAFEKELAEYVGIGHAAALSSGTAAIHLALSLLDVGRDDVVFCSSLTFVASCNPILYQGARPVFIDSEPETWNMSPQALDTALREAEAAGRLPKAVVVVNLYGQSADMDAINALCGRHGVAVVEDAAESLGATYRGKASGTFGRIGIFSFNGNKIITTSGGGMLIADDGELVKRARFLSTQARDPAGHYEHSHVGYNYRMSNILAGVGRGQLRVLEQRVAARREVFQRYEQGLGGIDAIQWMPEADFGRSNRWLSAFTLDKSRTALTPEALIEALAKERIEARRVWKPMHMQPLFAGTQYYPHQPGSSVSDEIFAQGICLPSGSNMTEGQQARVIEALSRILQS